MKRKVISVLLSLGMISALVTGCSSSSGTEETTSTDTAAEASADTEETADEAADTEETASTGEASATAGVIWYNFADTFIANARQCLNNVAAADGTISITDADSQNDIATQDNNLNNFITQKPKYLVINNINNPAADTIAATCTESGSVEYWKCSGCGKLFADAEGEREIEDAAVEALGHDWGEGEAEPVQFCTDDYTLTYTCQRAGCGETKAETVRGNAAHALDGRRRTAVPLHQRGLYLYEDGGHPRRGPYFGCGHGRQGRYLLRGGFATVQLHGGGL